MLEGERKVNLDLLRQRAQAIRQAIKVLAEYGKLPLQEFLADQTVVDASKYRLLVRLRRIEAATSISTHLAVRLIERSPDSYAQCFEALAWTGILPQELAANLGQMARFRNLLVHVYAEVDDERVWKVLQTDLGDLEACLSRVGDALKEQLI